MTQPRTVAFKKSEEFVAFTPGMLLPAWGFPIMNYFRLRALAVGTVCAILAVFNLSNAAHGALIQDQIGATVHNGGLGYAVQSFMPSQNNIAGIDVYISGTATLTTDVTLSIWEASAWNGTSFLGTEILTSILADVPRSTTAELRWSPVALTPEQTYMIEFSNINPDDGKQLGFGVLISSTDPYVRGEEQTFSTSNFIDVRFSTYYDDAFTAVPVPAAVWLFGSALGLLGWMRRKTA